MLGPYADPDAEANARYLRPVPTGMLHRHSRTGYTDAEAYGDGDTETAADADAKACYADAST